jgi:hypothetical protein
VAIEKKYFDETFGAFFRVNQMIITNKTEISLLDVESILELHDLQQNISNIVVPDLNNPRKLYNVKDLCIISFNNKVSNQWQKQMV